MGTKLAHVALIFLMCAHSSFEVGAVVDPSCTGLSKSVMCTKCSEDTGKCMQGGVPVDTWLQFATKTQRDLQMDEQFHRLQMLDAHNGYNTRADGYGVEDTCPWPPPYPQDCDNYANQEFSFTDLLNMGVRALEIDNWYCFNQMRLAHLGSTIDLVCSVTDRLFSEGIKEIADWLDQPGNEHELVKIYMNEKYDQGNDDTVNGPLGDYMGKKILTPSDLSDTYGEEWPTMRTMIKDGKNVVIASGSTAGSGEAYTHGGVYIHAIFWEDLKVSAFTNYPDCGGKTLTNNLRFYSDATHYGTNVTLKHDGPSTTGVIFDFSEYVKCRVQNPATDMITPELVSTAVFTWAEGEPTAPPTSESCVWISKTDWRWYLSGDCSVELYHACQSTNDPDDWTISSSMSAFSPMSSGCPDGYTFSVPQDGFRNQKLRDASNGNSVWINFTPDEEVSAAPSLGQSLTLLLLMCPAIAQFLRV
ncbi:uncharacterized protein MT2135-like [Asterias amurensis]|uniref:uncharacterized protein MT2135-like n=1 Tax=Asterias amurensis TaxID=7602 RepID=UPI003AB30644